MEADSAGLGYGLRLSERFFSEVGLPSLRRHFPSRLPEIAAGLAGPGSECFGVDDGLSRDHDWGPRFCVWLPEESHRSAGAAIQAWYDGLSKDFSGFREGRTLPGEAYRSGVSEIAAFFGRHSGLPRRPATLEDWLQVSEEGAATCTNGSVFLDNLGAFSEWRAALAAYYPPDLRLKKIAAHTFLAGQSAQYNYSRAMRRGHLFALRYLETVFCNELLALAYSLNRRFAPYFKWRHALAEGLPRHGRLAAALVQGILSADAAATKARLMDEACAAIAGMLREEGLAEAGSESLMDLALRINSEISDRLVREDIPFV
jgi:hypothetical protein